MPSGCINRKKLWRNHASGILPSIRFNLLCDEPGSVYSKSHNVSSAIHRRGKGVILRFHEEILREAFLQKPPTS